MSWFEIVPGLLTSALVLIGPGLVLGVSLRLKGLWLWSFAPAASTAILAITAVVLPLIGGSWTPIPIAISSLVLGGLIYFGLRVFRPKSQEPETIAPNTKSRAPIVGWAIAAGLLAWHFINGVGGPENISQTFDNVFHLNAITFIGETSNASPLSIGKLSDPNAGLGFYPVGWHALVQLVIQLSGASVPMAVNAFNMVVTCLIWPLGMMLLARQIAGKSPIVVVVAAILSASFPMMPLNLIHYGVLYPYFFGMTFVPLALALLLQVLNVTKDSTLGGKPYLVVLLAGVSAGIAMVHPAALMVVLALSVPVAVVATLADWRSLSRRARITRLSVFGIYFVCGMSMMYLLRRADHWGPRMSTLKAAWQTISLSMDGYGLPIATAALTILGIVIALVHRSLASVAAVGMWVVAALLFFVTAGLENGLIRFPSRIWYGDSPRLAAVLPIAVIPLATLAFLWLIRKTERFHRKTTVWVVSGSLVLLLVVTQLSAGFREFSAHMRSGYTMSDEAALISDDEYELLTRLESLTGEDAVIVGNPWTGTPLAFAFGNRTVMVSHPLENDFSSDELLILNHLRDANSMPTVCDAVERERAWYVLDFGEREVHGANHVYQGLEDLERSGAVTLIDEVGLARLFKVTACS